MKRQRSLPNSPDRLGTGRSSATCAHLLTISFIVGAVFMGFLALTAVCLGPMRSSDQFLKQGCDYGEHNPRQGSFEDTSENFDVEENPQLLAKIKDLEESLAHAHAVAAAAKPRVESALDRVAILGERNR